MYALYIDTHLDIIQIVILKDGKIIDKKLQESNMSHSIYTMPLIEAVFSENKIDLNDLKEIIVVNGPGSFTGVRIGITIAKTMAYSLNIPIKVISSLRAKAICVDSKEDKYIVISDKNGKYLGRFDSSNNKLDDYKYLSNKEYEKFEERNVFEDIDMDYELIYAYCKNIEETNPHEVNPIYIKNIDVVNG